MGAAISLVKLANYALQGMIFYWFFYSMLNSHTDYFRGMLEMMIISIFLNYVDIGLLTVPILSAQWVRPIVNSLVLVPSIMIILKSNFRETVLKAYLPFMLFISISELTVFGLMASFLGIDIESVYEKSLGMTVLFYLLCAVLDVVMLSVVIRFRGTGDISVVPNGMLFAILFGVIFQTIVLASLTYPVIYGGKINTVAAIIMTCLFILGEIGTFITQKNINYQKEILKQNSELNFAESAFDAQLSYLEAENKKAEILESEMKSAIQNLDQFNNQESISALYRDYCNYEYTDDVVLNALLESYAKRFNEMRINYHFQIECSMAHTLDSLEMVNVFSNLIDNSMEAVEQNPVKNRNINLNVKKAENLYQIDIENDLPQKNITLNKKVQGEGVKIIKDVLARHFGKMEISKDGETYRAVLTYQIGGESNEEA